jgi:ribosomal protein L20A (L18A)
MSKKSKAKKADFRKKEKASRKTRQQAVYASYRDAGTNQKSKRSKLKSKRVSAINTKRHSTVFCGNHGCSRCVPDLSAPKFNDSNDARVRSKTFEELNRV